jgi:hypothetical protein
MSDHLARDVAFRDRFLREARGAGILQHPNIVTLYELGERQGAPFIAMEFIEGRSLEDIIRNEKAMPLEERLDVVAQVCLGLDYAHSRGVVHRDIKPANIMVTRDGVAKIVDFGIARLADQQLTNTGHVLGTVSYMSPEVLQRQTPDGRSDIFAVGVMLFEALASVLPFAAENTAAAITKILYHRPATLSSFLMDYPKGLDEIISKCLAKHPNERFQTAGHLAARLSQVRHEAKGLQTANGLGAARGDVEAARRYRKAADQGLADAQVNLGYLYYLGCGVAKDHVEAARWWRKAADQWRADAQFNLGNLYYFGHGVAKGYREAARWYRKAADQGLADAQFNTGVIYEKGEGVEKNDVEAARWYRKAADQGFAEARVQLGRLNKKLGAAY